MGIYRKRCLLCGKELGPNHAGGALCEECKWHELQQYRSPLDGRH